MLKFALRGGKCALTADTFIHVSCIDCVVTRIWPQGGDSYILVVGPSIALIGAIITIATMFRVFAGAWPAAARGGGGVGEGRAMLRDLPHTPRSVGADAVCCRAALAGRGDKPAAAQYHPTARRILVNIL
jgi:hypothetical protein